MKTKKFENQILDAELRLIFGRCLRAVRIADGTVQLYVGRHMGVTRSTVALYETGRSWPSALAILSNDYGRRAAALYRRFIDEHKISVEDVVTPAYCDGVIARLLASAPVPS